ncbi:transposase [Streptomyces sp. NPDC005899]|uniref:transposase n=1 Tax=Streptomyces sp. NPDC005899 TaxID=3155716 RepID=UPI0033C7FA59
MKNYPPECKADAVALYESRPEATIRSVAADPGISTETLRNWVRAAGVSRPRGRRTQEPSQPPAPLEAENAALRKKVCEQKEEREILWKAAKYFAGETSVAWSESPLLFFRTPAGGPPSGRLSLDSRLDHRVRRALLAGSLRAPHNPGNDRSYRPQSLSTERGKEPDRCPSCMDGVHLNADPASGVGTEFP